MGVPKRPIPAQFLNCLDKHIALFCLVMAEKEELKYVLRNRKARHDYAIQETFEAGIELKGSEVKSLRDGKANMSDAYALVEKGQVFLRNLNITPYKMSSDSPDPIRPRRLLLHSRQIRRLAAETDQKGKSLIPLSIYFKGRLAKVELAIGVGRKKYDKREKIAEAESERRIRRALRKDLKD
jgi:SsrA-binding protein